MLSPLSQIDAAAVGWLHGSSVWEIELAGVPHHNRADLPNLRASVPGRHVRKLAVCLDETVGQSEFGLRSAARTLHMSPRSVQRRLAEAGTSASQMVQQAKLRKAAALLREPMPLEEVARQSGFWDVSHLRRRVLAMTGLSLTAFASYCRTSRH